MRVEIAWSYSTLPSWPAASRERAEQRGLARAARADDAEQAALAEREADVIEQHLAAGQPNGELLRRSDTSPVSMNCCSSSPTSRNVAGPMR